MKVKLDDKGKLLIKTETKIESYALNKWMDDNISQDKINCNNLIFKIDHNIYE